MKHTNENAYWVGKIFLRNRTGCQCAAYSLQGSAQLLLGRHRLLVHSKTRHEKSRLESHILVDSNVCSNTTTQLHDSPLFHSKLSWRHTSIYSSLIVAFVVRKVRSNTCIKISMPFIIGPTICARHFPPSHAQVLLAKQCNMTF
jgi:hypothetical protein